jgi:hypothetical protein
MSMFFDEYYYDRAEAELEQAQRAQHPAAVKVHYTLAGYYLDRFYGELGSAEPQVLSAMSERANLPGG